MKIPRRKKNDRTAFFFMEPRSYHFYRLSINPERRLDKTLPPETKQARDRQRAEGFRRRFKQGPGFRLSELLSPERLRQEVTPGPGVPVEQLFISKPDEMPPHEN